MALRDLFSKATPKPDSLPPFVREVKDIGTVRVVRLHGPVGKEIGKQVTAFVSAAEQQPEPFAHALLLDFAGATDVDFSTLAYVVEAIKKRLAKHSRVGIINPPPELVSEIEIAHLGDLITVYKSEAEALKLLGAPA